VIWKKCEETKMIIIDTSAWIEYLGGGIPSIVEKVDRCLEEEIVGVGDLIYCEIMQGIRSSRARKEVADLLRALPRFEMVGFSMAEKSASNYRLLRSKGVTVRKTIDVLIGTFCSENGFPIIHHDSDFDLMAKHIGLDIL
jgi:predicted nucleic acid-binding protein